MVRRLTDDTGLSHLPNFDDQSALASGRLDLETQI